MNDASADVRASLADLLDSLLDKGAVVSGDVMLSVAGVDLVWVGLKAVIWSVETARPAGHGSGRAVAGSSGPRVVASSLGPADACSDDLPKPARGGAGAESRRLAAATPPPEAASPAPQSPAQRARRLDIDHGNVERGLVQLVLTVTDLLRELLERQAIRRMAAGTMTDTEVEELGSAFRLLAERMEDLKAQFGLDDEDLRLDLGPIGALV